MDKNFLKYFSGELSSSESQKFLQEVDSDESLKKDFIHYQNIYSVSQLSSQAEDKAEGTKSYEKFFCR